MSKNIFKILVDMFGVFRVWFFIKATRPLECINAAFLIGFGLFSLSYLFIGINIFSSGMFTALSNGKVSAIISFLRTFVFLVAAVLLLPQLLGINGVWLSVPIAELLTLFVSIGYLVKYKKVYAY